MLINNSVSGAEDETDKNWLYGVLLDKVDALTVITLGEVSVFGSRLADFSEEGAKTIQQIVEAMAQYPG